MTKKRNIDEIHDLKRVNKQLQEDIKKLERQLNNQSKKENTTKPKVKDEPAPKDPADCPECQNGKIEVVELGVRKMVSCTLKCGYRKVIKN